MRNLSKAFVILVLGLILSVPAFCGEANTFSTAVQDVVAAPTVLQPLNFNAPHDVIQIRATSTGNFLNVSVLDCCIAGDMWTQRTFCLQNGSIWDVRGKGFGNTTGAYTGSTVIYKKGTQPIDCITEVRYGEGVSTWPAGMTVQFVSDAAVTTTVLPTLNPLVSQ